MKKYFWALPCLFGTVTVVSMFAFRMMMVDINTMTHITPTEADAEIMMFIAKIFVASFVATLVTALVSGYIDKKKVAKEEG